MFSHSGKRVVWFPFFCLILVTAQIAFAGGDEKWREVTQAELQMKTPKVEADADAEAIFWEVRLADTYAARAGFKTILNHYLRIKIFTELGREKNSKVDIPFGKIPGYGVNISIKDIAARTIKPDGTIIEVKAADIFERDIVKANGVKLKAKSFAMPGIETGAIIEYRWKEVHEDSLSYYVRLHFSREIPVQFVKYYVKPVKVPNFMFGMKLHSFNIENHFTADEDGFYSSTMTYVKAFQEEPRMPSEFDVRPWTLVYYAKDDKMTAEKYWKERGKNTFEYHKTLLQPTDEIRQAAVQVVGDATEAEEKIRRIFDFCRRNIKNIDDDASGLTGDQKEKIKINRTTAETFKRRAGDWHDINMVFGAMLVSIGFDVRVANVALRSDASFDKNFTNDYLLRTENIAVKIGNEWKFYDAATSYVPFGMLYWSEEGQQALISDANEPIWVTMPVSSPENTKEKRTARLRLNEDGSITGDVRIEYSGHLAEYHKEFNDDDSPAEREKTLVEMIKRDMSATAEVTEISIENVQEPDKPFVYSFKIRLPAYSERTGKRVFVRPNIFERNTNALFRTSARKYDISFEYPWSEEDDITIELPAGYLIESAEAPPVVRDEKGIGSHQIKILLSDDKKTLTYQRKFSFGNKGNLVFSKYRYSFLKELFEGFHSADEYTVALKQE
jgi:hypothetical protein